MSTRAEIAARIRSRALPILLVAGALACSTPRYSYAPVRATSADLAGAPAAIYSIPPDDPRGDVRLATFGMARLVPDEVEDSALWAVHIALVVTNRSDETWSVDGTEQQLRVENGNDLVQATNDQLDDPPVMAVPPHGVTWVHLFFPLDPQRPRFVPAFEVRWTLRTSTRVFHERTLFERFALEPRHVENDDGLPVLEKNEGPDKWSPSSPNE